MTTRRFISTRERVRLFQRAGGCCQLCGMKIAAGAGFDVDHITPLELGGEDDTPNFQVVCRPCHRIKTAQDVTAIRKAQRREARQIGARVSRNPLPGGRKSKWRKRLDGSVVLREGSHE